MRDKRQGWARTYNRQEFFVVYMKWLCLKCRRVRAEGEEKLMTS